MKKITIVFVLFVILATNAFTQTVALEVHGSIYPDSFGRDFINSNLSGYSGSDNIPSIFPSIGLVINVGNVDIMTNISFWYSETSDKKYWENKQLLFGIYAGIAPKKILTNNLTISFPILAKYFYQSHVVNDDNDIDSQHKSNLIGLDLGLRMYFDITERFSFFAGWLQHIVEHKMEGEIQPLVGSSYSDENHFLTFFNGGTLNIGIRVDF